MLLKLENVRFYLKFYFNTQVISSLFLCECSMSTCQYNPKLIILECMVGNWYLVFGIWYLWNALVGLLPATGSLGPDQGTTHHLSSQNATVS